VTASSVNPSHSIINSSKCLACSYLRISHSQDFYALAEPTKLSSFDDFSSAIAIGIAERRRLEGRDGRAQQSQTP
jgi:hypothetical protein